MFKIFKKSKELVRFAELLSEVDEIKRQQVKTVETLAALHDRIVRLEAANEAAAAFQSERNEALVKTLEQRLNASSQEVRREALSEAQMVVNAVQGGFFDRLTVLSDRVTALELEADQRRERQLPTSFSEISGSPSSVSDK